MEFLFGVFSGLADAATRAKFTMASPARAAAVLFTYVDPVHVPARWVGVGRVWVGGGGCGRRRGNLGGI